MVFGNIKFDEGDSLGLKGGFHGLFGGGEAVSVVYKMW